MRIKHHITAMPSPYIYYSYLIYRKRNGTIQFLHPSLYFMSLWAVINLLSRPLRSASSFPSFRIFVPFSPLLRSLCSALSFPLFRFFVSFGPLFRFLRSVSCFFWFVSTRHCVVVRSFLFSSSLPFCQVFSLLSNPTHALQHLRPCPSTFKTTPFLPQDHALQRSRTHPSSCVSVCIWYRVSCGLGFVPCCPLYVGTFVRILVKFFHKTKRLFVFFSHRFSQMNRSLSAHRGNSQTSASRRQISQSVTPIMSWNVLCYRLT